MKKALSTVLGILALHASANAASIITLNSAFLTLENALSRLPDGSLIQLVASTTDATFAAPSSGSFVGGSVDDVVVARFLLDSSTFGGQAGGFSKSISLDYTAGAYGGLSLSQNDPLLLRWWPTKDLTSVAPQTNDRYGEFRIAAVMDGSSIGWAIPANNSSATLNFATLSAGGSQPNSSGAASKLVATPEPATAALAVLGAVPLLARRRRQSV